MPAVAMEAEVQKGGEAAGCWEAGVEVASCPLEVAADLTRRHQEIQLSTTAGFSGFVLICCSE